MTAMTSTPLVGFPAESAPGERRTLLTPATAQTLTGAGFTVLTQPGIGAGVGITDQALRNAGARFTDDTAQIWSAPLVLRYKSPNPDDLKRLPPGGCIAALFHAEGEVALLEALKATRVAAWSFEFVRQDGRFPLALAGGRIAGVQAVLAGAQALQRPDGRGVLLADVPGAAVPRVLVIGSGNVGAAAAQTAAALGACVTVLAHTGRSAATYQRHAPDGVAVRVNTRETLREELNRSDLTIGAILESTFDTPPMVETGDLALMPRGAVIVDATCGYGPGYLPTAGPVQRPGDPPHVVDGIAHIKIDILPALVPVTATTAYTCAAAPYLARLARTALTGCADTAIDSALIARHGHLVHPVLVKHALQYGVTP